MEPQLLFLIFPILLKTWKLSENTLLSNGHKINSLISIKYKEILKEITVIKRDLYDLWV